MNKVWLIDGERNRPTPRPEQIRRKSQTRPFLPDSYLSVGVKRTIPLFL
ncbi:hypothetical protein [Metabacillus hrfriensis]|uniref:Uncharacterized protein n=1 Tax=Metabacillus hrfriensis TaxID=3048891 RepID=A0ACD4RDJ3_9BACI|nr:hypothetical protein [Metabacillus sp. CT-WN-B3]WHZ58552.1 hypothetical protein QLQ22_04185 [Metabacillus sp. CT-WN-B3]